MAPPSNKPKLSQVDPQALALETARRFRDHLQSQLFHVSPLGVVRTIDIDDDDLVQSEIGLAVRTLAGFARGDHGIDAPVQEYWVSLVPLWSSALGMADHEDVGANASPNTELGLVMAAAKAREEVLGGRPVNSTQLALLASLSPRAVQKLVADGEIAAGDDGISASTARRWLAARGVPGFVKKGKRT